MDSIITHFATWSRKFSSWFHKNKQQFNLSLWNYRYGTHDIILLTQDKVELRKLRKMTVFPRCIGRHTKWVKFFSQQF